MAAFGRRRSDFESAFDSGAGPVADSTRYACIFWDNVHGGVVRWSRGGGEGHPEKVFQCFRSAPCE